MTNFPFKTIYIEIWPEAAALRRAGSNDKRLNDLNNILKRYGAQMIQQDRIGNCEDNHFVIALSEDADELEFFEFYDQMNSTSEIRRTGFDKPIELLIPNQAIAKELDDRHAFWQNGQAMPESFLGRKTFVLLNSINRTMDWLSKHSGTSRKPQDPSL